MNWFVDTVSQHSTALGWTAFFVSLIPVYIANRELRKKAWPKKSWRRCLRYSEFFLLWCIPLLGFVATKASEWASASTEEKIGTQAKEITSLSNRVFKAEAELAPKPVEVRLRAWLNRFAPVVMQVLARDKKNILVREQFISSDALELNRMASEPGAEKYIRILSPGELRALRKESMEPGTEPMTMALGSDGTVLSMLGFIVSTNLIDH